MEMRITADFRWKQGPDPSHIRGEFGGRPESAG